MKVMTITQKSHEDTSDLIRRVDLKLPKDTCYIASAAIYKLSDSEVMDYFCGKKSLTGIEHWPTCEYRIDGEFLVSSYDSFSDLKYLFNAISDSFIIAAYGGLTRQNSDISYVYRADFSELEKSLLKVIRIDEQ